MPVSINGVEQMPEEWREAQARNMKWAKAAVWVAAVSLIVAIAAIVITILW